MRKVAFLLVCAAAAVGCASSQTYGARPALDAPALPLARALVPSNVGKTIALQGQVADVCQMKGCWMVLTDGTRAVRTTFKDYGFFVPKDLAGRTVTIEVIPLKGRPGAVGISLVGTRRRALVGITGRR